MAKALVKGSRITGAQRGTLATQFGKRYAAGDSIRQIAEDAGRSFGFVHGVLKEAGVELRGRGGATRGAARTGAPTTTENATTKQATAKQATAKTAPPAKAPPAKKATTRRSTTTAAKNTAADPG